MFERFWSEAAIRTYLTSWDYWWLVFVGRTPREGLCISGMAQNLPVGTTSGTNGCISVLYE